MSSAYNITVIISGRRYTGDSVIKALPSIEDKALLALELLKSIRSEKDKLPFGIGLEMTINWVEYFYAKLTNSPNLFECWVKLLNLK